MSLGLVFSREGPHSDFCGPQALLPLQFLSFIENIKNCIFTTPLTQSQYNLGWIYYYIFIMIIFHFLLSLKEIEHQTFSCVFNSIVGLDTLPAGEVSQAQSTPRRSEGPSRDSRGFWTGWPGQGLKYNCLRPTPLWPIQVTVRTIALTHSQHLKGHKNVFGQELSVCIWNKITPLCLYLPFSL